VSRDRLKRRSAPDVRRTDGPPLVGRFQAVDRRGRGRTVGDGYMVVIGWSRDDRPLGQDFSCLGEEVKHVVSLEEDRGSSVRARPSLP
jgi:hypothetical protein